MIRLDAFAYATKKAGTSCFFIEPDIWDLLDECTEILKPYHVEIPVSYTHLIDVDGSAHPVYALYEREREASQEVFEVVGKTA